MLFSNTLKKTILSLAVTSSLSLTALNATAKEFVLLVDASLSNPMLVDKTFNRRATEFVAQEIQGLERGDVVSIQTFGSLQKADNFATKQLTVSRHNHKKVAAAVAKYMLSLPDTLEPQGSTNLIAWFNRNPMDCRDGGKILAVTDAIEASEYIDPNHLLSGKQTLPRPSQYVNINGCEIVFFGVGAGRLDQETINLKQAWSQYFQRAGASFNAVAL